MFRSNFGHILQEGLVLVILHATSMGRVQLHKFWILNFEVIHKGLLIKQLV
jgi:hypothetical protein